jgi:LuxR family maltose regulon positive regulatory protein
LAGIFLRGQQDPARAVAEFRGDHRFVADYLSGVALATLDDDVRDFLLRAAVLGRFTLDLCAHALGRADSAAMLDVLERANVLVARLDRGWFRIHPLLAEFARFHLSATDPAAEAEIHRRATQWYLAQGLVEEALDHALEAGDHELVAALVEEHNGPLFWGGRIRTLVRVVRKLPDSVVAEHPHAAMAAAISTTVIGHGAVERRRYLTMVSRARVDHPERVTLYVSGAAAMLRAMTIEGGVAAAVQDGRQAIVAARAGAGELSVSSLGGCALALFFAGDLREAAALATEAINLPEAARRPPGHALARSVLSMVESERGQIDRARGHAEVAKSLVGGIGNSRSWLGAHAAASLGSVHAAEGDLVQAELDFAYAERFFDDEVASVQHSWLLLMLARVRGRRGHLDEAWAALSTAQAALAELGDTGRLPELAAAVTRELEDVASRAAGGELVSAPTEAELAVLRLLVTALSAREIGGKLYISANTVHSHTRSLYRKLGVRTRAEAVARATAIGLLTQPESPR